MNLTPFRGLARIGLAGWMLISVAGFSGCGAGVQAPPEEFLVSAGGKVLVDGKPAGGIRIRLNPINDTKSVGGAWAVTKEDGTFNVMHWTNKEGIAAGSYMATFSKYVKPDGSPLGENESPAMVNAKELIAPTWSSPTPDRMAETMRRVDIPEGGKSDLEFKITGSK